MDDDISVEQVDSDMDPAGLDRVLALVHGRGHRQAGQVAQLCVLRHGRVVLNHSVGCEPDSLFLLYSAGKPMVAVLIHLLAERGLLSLDDPVARHWPEYARHGKDAITVRHVLQHRAGVPLARGNVLSDALAMTDWERSVRYVELARPKWPAGQVPAYHIISYGFILGELVRRITGTPVDELLRSELLNPLALPDIHLGLPRRLRARAVPVRGVGGPGSWGYQVFFNRRSVRTAVIPSANVSATARDLAFFYQMLLRGGELGGTRVLSASTVKQARVPSTQDGEVDHLLKLPIRWSHGFQLGGMESGRTRHPMGTLSSREAFGHNGSNYCNAWADPSRDLVFVYLTNLLVPAVEGAEHQTAVSDAVLSACR